MKEFSGLSRTQLEELFRGNVEIANDIASYCENHSSKLLGRIVGKLKVLLQARETFWICPVCSIDAYRQEGCWAISADAQKLDALLNRYSGICDVIATMTNGCKVFEDPNEKTPYKLVLFGEISRETQPIILAFESQIDETWQARIACINALVRLLLQAVVDKNGEEVIIHTDFCTQFRPSGALSFHQTYNFNDVDSLTRLLNRDAMQLRVNQIIEIVSEKECYGAFLLLDIDDFKYVNDAEGHSFGDEVLSEISDRIVNILPKNGVAARLGSDLFALVVGEIGATNKEAEETAERLSEQVHRAINRPIRVDQASMQVTASIGAALFYNYASSFDELIRHSELSMFKAKEDGKNCTRFFSTELQQAVNERMDLENALRKAVKDEQLLLHYQPQVNTFGKTLGVEALVRWRRPDVGMISPGTFIPFAEQRGLILEIGKWVLINACNQLAKWRRKGVPFDQMVVSVNVSAKQFEHPNFVAEVENVLHATGAEPNRLKLELTESVLAKGLSCVGNKMIELRALGVRLSLDDFGTGYSSLRYLRELPFDELKIDQSFVRGISEQCGDVGLVSMILALAKHRGFSAIAEGIETENELTVLKELGCGIFQGYLFGRPMEIDSLEKFITQE